MSAPGPHPARWREHLHWPHTPRGWAAVVVVLTAVILIGAILAARHFARTPQGVAMIQAQASGLSLGQVGRLQIEGLQGDPLADFTVRRLAIADDQGVWLEARGLHVRWSYGALLIRRLQIQSATVKELVVLRRPHLGPKGPPSGGLPLAIDIRSIQLRLKTLPAFSVRPGLYDVTGGLVLKRHGRGEAGSVQARSLLHPGDFLDARFDIGRRRPVRLDARAVEAMGGALAGALGLPADRPLQLRAHAAGTRKAGRLDAVLTSGAARPLFARGDWNEQGGLVSGRVSLTASSLTRPYAQALGPQVIFAVAERRARKGRPGATHGVAARLLSQGLVVLVQGPADPKTMTSTPGLVVAAVAPSLSRLTGQPGLGAARVQGLLSGRPSEWRLAGDASVQDLSVDGYRLARLAGPFSASMKGRQATLQLAVAGAGGQGDSLAAGLLGRAPKASVSLDRLADGRIVIRKADASGAGLRLAASGSRNLLGGLDLKGELDLTDLSLARQGAGGTMTARWAASQASGVSPWLLTLDGRGHGFHSGLFELDRLLGTEARVSAKGSIAKGAVQLTSLALEGSKASASAKGRIGPGGGLALTANWTAEGPFQVGPVVISGKTSGAGEVTGSLSAPRADLTADVAAIDIPRLPLTSAHLRLSFISANGGLEGAIAVAGSSPYGPARANSNFRLVKGGAALSGIDADAGGVKVAGELALRGGQPSTADLQPDNRSRDLADPRAGVRDSQDRRRRLSVGHHRPSGQGRGHPRRGPRHPQRQDLRPGSAGAPAIRDLGGRADRPGPRAPRRLGRVRTDGRRAHLPGQWQGTLPPDRLPDAGAHHGELVGQGPLHAHASSGRGRDL